MIASTDHPDDAIASRLRLVCPACHKALAPEEASFACAGCARRYPVIAGIPDLRLEADPYISIDDDRRKAEHLAGAAATRTFEELVRYYYEITPEDPPDLAARWTARAIAETEIGRRWIDAIGFSPAAIDGPLLDLGCGTGGLTIALAERGWRAVGVDVALRWLVVARHRARGAGSSAAFVCASARHLPFAAGVAAGIVGNDLIEHVEAPAGVLRESARVAAPGAPAIFTANNRFAPLPEPQLRLWGVGYLPRRWQRRYVSWRRRDTHPYRITLPSARELMRMIRAAGFDDARATPAPLIGPHVASAAVRSAAAIYNRVCRWPIIRSALILAGPRVAVRARRGR